MKSPQEDSANMLSPHVLSLISQVNQITKTWQEDRNAEAKSELLVTCKNLTAALETPFETIRRIAIQPFETLALRVAVQLDFFDAVKENEAVTAKDLAMRTKADHLLIVRLMRVLCSMGVFQEIDIETYEHGRVSSAFCSRPFLRDHVLLMFDCGFNAAVKLPPYLEKTAFANPIITSAEAGYKGLWQYAFNTPLDFWGWLKEDPERARIFNSSVTSRHDDAEVQVEWHEKYPVIENLCSNLSSDADQVILVDVGGGWGQDLIAFSSAHPGLPGRLLVQDLEYTLAEADVEILQSRGIEVQVHNFFDAQPVQGAKAYFFHHILHDWSDDKCRTILRQTVAAMKHGNGSRLLILEHILPDMGASTLSGMNDMIMMLLFGSMERTEKQWRELLSQEGLGIVRIWKLGENSESLIEAVLKE